MSWFDLDAECRDAVAFADGLEVAFPDLARRLRMLARELMTTRRQLEDERRLRQAMQAARDRALELNVRGALERGCA